MCSQQLKTEDTNFIMRPISVDQQQTAILFTCHESCDTKQVEENYKVIVSAILNERDVIVVSKDDQFKDLISDNVNASDRERATAGAIEVVSFTPKPESNVKHRATLVKKMPTSVAKDLATSSDFVLGNLWFVIPKTDVDSSRRDQLLIDDVRKLTPSNFSIPPVLQHEVVASPAMYDGLQILWFNYNENILVERFGHMHWGHYGIARFACQQNVTGGTGP